MEPYVYIWLPPIQKKGVRMKYLVTGAAGFVGFALCQRLLQDGHEVVALDKHAFGEANFAQLKAEKISADFAALTVRQLGGFDAVFHQAAISDPTYPEEEEIMRVNFTNAVALAEKCQEAGVPFIYASSAAVYGNAPVPQVEFESEQPHNAYARSKLRLDEWARAKIAADAGPQIVGLRYFNIYGPGESTKGKTCSIVLHFLKSMLSGKQPVVFGDGKQKRDFVYIVDIVAANLLALESGKSGIANVGSGRAVTFNELVKVCSSAVGKEFEPEYRPNPLSKNYQYATLADLAGARRLFGYSPKWNIEKGAREYCAQLREKGWQ